MHHIPDVICAGIIVADHACAPIARMPAAGELVLTEQMALHVGGCAANVAIDLHKMGVFPAIVGHVGDDAFGRAVAHSLGEHGLELSRLRISKEHCTSQTLIVNVAGEDRRFIHTMGANAEFVARDIPTDGLERCKILYLGGYLLMPNLLQHELAEVFATVRAAGSKTILDVCVPGPGDYVAQLKDVLPHVDVFMPNDLEAEVITGESDPIRQAAVLHRLGAKTVVITCGGRGTVVVSDEVKLRAGVYPVDFVDGSGGGDAFAAGYVFGMLQDADVAECVRYGSALGASCVRKVGTTSGVFNRSECEEFVSRHELAIAPL